MSSQDLDLFSLCVCVVPFTMGVCVFVCVAGGVLYVGLWGSQVPAISVYPHTGVLQPWVSLGTGRHTHLLGYRLTCNLL